MKLEQREELAACPFCGDADSQLIEHVEGTIIHPAYFVKCDNCGALGPTTDRSDHRELWNRRAQVEALNRKNLELQRVYDERGLQIERLEMALQRAKVEALTVPQGWKLAPIEPTPAMLERARNAPLPMVMIDSMIGRINLRIASEYGAMLDAAPTIPAIPGTKEGA